VVASRDTGEGEYSERLKREVRREVSSLPPPPLSSSSSPSSPQSTGSGTARGAPSRGKESRGWKRNILNKKDYLQVVMGEVCSRGGNDFLKNKINPSTSLVT